MSGAECVCRILAHLDARGIPDGSIVDLDVEAVEIIAGWTGQPGVLPNRQRFIADVQTSEAFASVRERLLQLQFHLLYLMQQLLYIDFHF